MLKHEQLHFDVFELYGRMFVKKLEEGDALNPIKFTAIPLPRVCLMNGPDGRIDTIYRTRIIKPDEVKILYPRAVLPENFDPLKHKKVAH